MGEGMIYAEMWSLMDTLTSINPTVFKIPYKPDNPVPPPPPINVLTSVVDDQIQVTWDPVDDVDGYLLVFTKTGEDGFLVWEKRTSDTGLRFPIPEEGVYLLNIFSQRGDLRSETSTSVKIVFEQNEPFKIHVTNVTSTSFVVIPPQGFKSNLNPYVEVMDLTTNEVNKRNIVLDYPIFFTALAPGRLYNVSLYSQDDILLAGPRRVRTYPLPVEENIEIFYEDGIFQFRFDTVRGDWDYYEVDLYTSDMYRQLVEGKVTNVGLVNFEKVQPL